MKKIVDDVAALRPTLFIAVPRVLERIQSGIAGKIAGQGAVAKLVFGLAYKIKQMRLWMGSSVEGVSLCLCLQQCSISRVQPTVCVESLCANAESVLCRCADNYLGCALIPVSWASRGAQIC